VRADSNGTLPLCSKDSPLTVISIRPNRGKAAGQSVPLAVPALLHHAYVRALRAGDRYCVVDGTAVNEDDLGSVAAG
jgi:hypothetical protein